MYENKCSKVGVALFLNFPISTDVNSFAKRHLPFWRQIAAVVVVADAAAAAVVARVHITLKWGGFKWAGGLGTQQVTPTYFVFATSREHI